jgi:hypothetical protein
LFDFPGSDFIVTVEVDDIQRGGLLQSVDVHVAHRRLAAVSPEVFVRNIPASAFTRGGESNLPRTTISVNGSDVLTLLNRTASSMEGGDFIEFRMTLNLTDGRSFTNTNANGDVAGGAFFRSPFFYRATVVCPSDLGGTHNYVTTNVLGGGGAPGTGADAGCGTLTGTVTFDPVAGSPGTYNVSDASFGVFVCLGYGTARGLQLSDACGRVTFTQVDQFGDAYIFTFVSNNGTSLVFDFENTWGDGGRVTLTRAGGATWPNGLR